MEMEPDDHIGDVIAAIEYREQLVSRLRAVVDLAQKLEPKKQGAVARELVNMSNELRDVGIRCVKNIIAWTMFNTEPGAESPKRFTWINDEEYLVKMLNDLDFVSERLPESIRAHGHYEPGDPLFLSKISPNAQRRAAVAATLVILDAVTRKAKIDNMKASFSRRSQSELSINKSRSREETAEKDLFDNSEQPKERSFEKPVTSGDCSTGAELESGNKEPRARSRRGAISRRASENVLPEPSNEPPKSHPDEPARRHRHTKEVAVFRGRYLYRRGDLMGQGAYATVYECYRQDGRKFAVKIFGAEKAADDGAAEYRNITLGREVRILKTFKHPNIIQFEESFVHKGVPHIVMERMSCTLMQTNVDRYPGATIKLLAVSTQRHHDPNSVMGPALSLQLAAFSVINQILSALVFLHSNNIIHRDIKPSNILVSVTPKGFQVKLGDFGSARELPVTMESYPDLTNYVGSRWYRAPEVLGQNTTYSYLCDMWSLGCTVAEFLNGKAPFRGDTEQEVLDSILSYRFVVPLTLRREFESRGLVLAPYSRKADRPLLSSFFEKVLLASAIQKSFADLILDRMLILADIERSSAKDLQKMLMHWFDEYKTAELGKDDN